MFLAVEMVPFARLLISGGNGSAFSFSIYFLLFFSCFQDGYDFLFLIQECGIGQWRPWPTSSDSYARYLWWKVQRLGILCDCIPFCFLGMFKFSFLANPNFSLYEIKIRIHTSWLRFLGIQRFREFLLIKYEFYSCLLLRIRAWKVSNSEWLNRHSSITELTWMGWKPELLFFFS